MIAYNQIKSGHNIRQRGILWKECVYIEIMTTHVKLSLIRCKYFNLFRKPIDVVTSTYKRAYKIPNRIVDAWLPIIRSKAATISDKEAF